MREVEYLKPRSKNVYNSSVEFANAQEHFFKIYANLPLNLREEIILVLEGEPISWRVAYLEVKSGTKKSRLMLEKLAALELI